MKRKLKQGLTLLKADLADIPALAYPHGPKASLGTGLSAARKQISLSRAGSKHPL